MNRLANIDLRRAASEVWDAIVIGAGPAGALAAQQLATRDARVLLVERKSFPRYKVCGACVNHRAIKTLESAGLIGLIESLPAQSLNRMRLYSGRHQTDLSLAGGVAVSRSLFDYELTQSAIHAGACFLDKTSATVLPESRPKKSSAKLRQVRQLRLVDDENESIAETRVVLAADGLTGSSLRDCEVPFEVRENSRVGFGGVVDAGVAGTTEPNTIHMAVHPRGYVGIVRVEEERLNVAGAADADFLRECGGPAACALRVLESTGCLALDGKSVDVSNWNGTPTLTRRRKKAAGHRSLLLGDATGYVEPFTGEGIAWALTSAYQAVPLAIEGIDDWSPSIEHRWQQLRDTHAARHQRVCRAMARLLRSPALVRLSIGAVSTFPLLATPLLSRINAPAV